MGQAASRSGDAPSQRTSRMRHDRSSSPTPSSDGDDRPASRLATVSEMSTSLRRRASWIGLGRFREQLPSTGSPTRQSPSRLRMHRPRLAPSLSSLGSLSRRISTRRFTRREHSYETEDEERPSGADSLGLTRSNDPGYRLPDFDVPRFEFDMDHFSDDVDPGGRSSSRRSALQRPSSSFSERFSSLRPDRGIRNMTSSLRRRRSPLSRDEDQATMLSRLLSVAAAATAATLMNGDQRAVSEARSISGDGEDGTFESFIRALQNGRIASALRQSGSESLDEPDADGNPAAPLNFFRMFRFGPSAATANGETGTNRGGSVVADSADGTNGEDGRMVPIIIVGIRSISPGSQDQDNMPPFLDALQSFPSSLTSPSDVTFDGLLRQPQHGTRITHRRRASMGGLGTFPANYDSQRHHRSPDRPRPLSTTSDTPSGPRPPPSTPASAGLSAFSSGATTPTTIDALSSPPHTDMSSRRSSFAPRSASAIAGLETPVEEPSTQQQRPPRQRRRRSESDFSHFGSGSSRRNGVVAPDAPTDMNEGSRSWIIYVLGGSYPENHPILTTPSLFTDSPTYEDMLLLSALLGPAKPPVASEADVASAPGLLVIKEAMGRLVATLRDVGDQQQAAADAVALAIGERCQICLCDYEVGEESRKLVKCGHLFHRECIDQWLTTGRNSCPLCRGQGVDEKTTAPEGAVRQGPNTPTMMPTPLADVTENPVGERSFEL